MACDGEEAVHPSVPMLCMQTGHSGAVDGGAALQMAADVRCHCGQQGALCCQSL